MNSLENLLPEFILSVGGCSRKNNLGSAVTNRCLSLLILNARNNNISWSGESSSGRWTGASTSQEMIPTQRCIISQQLFLQSFLHLGPFCVCHFTIDWHWNSRKGIFLKIVFCLVFFCWDSWKILLLLHRFFFISFICYVTIDCCWVEKQHEFLYLSKIQILNQLLRII